MFLCTYQLFLSVMLCNYRPGMGVHVPGPTTSLNILWYLSFSKSLKVMKPRIYFKKFESGWRYKMSSDQESGDWRPYNIKRWYDWFLEKHESLQDKSLWELQWGTFLFWCSCKLFATLKIYKCCLKWKIGGGYRARFYYVLKYQHRRDCLRIVPCVVYR